MLLYIYIYKTTGKYGSEKTPYLDTSIGQGGIQA